MDTFDSLLTSFIDDSPDGEGALDRLILAAARDPRTAAHISLPGVAHTALSGCGRTAEGTPLPVDADNIADYGSYCIIA
ncbi:pheromone [Schizophyllum fasciatum]